VRLAQIARQYDLDAKRISNWKTKFDSGSALVSVAVTTDDDHVAMPAGNWQRPSTAAPASY